MNFEKDYYIDSSISNYVNYTCKKFNGLYDDLITLPITKEDSILDFGCATGGLVNCFYQNGYTNIKGTDISYWAINYGRTQFNLSADILNHYNRQLLENNFNFIFFLDVLEHIPLNELNELLSLIKKTSRLIVRIPVSKVEGENFVLEVSKNDKTHIQIHDKEWWINLFKKHGFNNNNTILKDVIYESEGVLAREFFNE
jgi:2-polyprenyl-3-methyl-5-hydroxy-6-metoxy-1,4-benzoquinol methylase